MDFMEHLETIRERTTPVADTPIIPPKTKHQRQSELRMIWRNKGVEGVQSIFLEKCSPSGKPPAVRRSTSPEARRRMGVLWPALM